MKLMRIYGFSAILATLLMAGDARPEATENPLEPFAPFIGGQWHLEGSYTELEWGVGRRAVNARSYFFQYTARFEGDAMILDLRAFAASGKETKFVETWTPEDDAHFAWSLTSETADGQEQTMSGTYTRRRD